MSTYIKEYNNLLLKYSEFKKYCDKFNFSIYFNGKFKEIINWLINNKTEDEI